MRHAAHERGLLRAAPHAQRSVDGVQRDGRRHKVPGRGGVPEGDDVDDESVGVRVVEELEVTAADELEREDAEDDEHDVRRVGRERNREVVGRLRVVADAPQVDGEAAVLRVGHPPAEHVRDDHGDEEAAEDLVERDGRLPRDAEEAEPYRVARDGQREQAEQHAAELAEGARRLVRAAPVGALRGLVVPVVVEEPVRADGQQRDGEDRREDHLADEQVVPVRQQPRHGGECEPRGAAAHRGAARRHVGGDDAEEGRRVDHRVEDPHVGEELERDVAREPPRDGVQRGARVLGARVRPAARRNRRREAALVPGELHGARARVVGVVDANGRPHAHVDRGEVLPRVWRIHRKQPGRGQAQRKPRHRPRPRWPAADARPARRGSRLLRHGLELCRGAGAAGDGTISAAPKPQRDRRLPDEDDQRGEEQSERGGGSDAGAEGLGLNLLASDRPDAEEEPAAQQVGATHDPEQHEQRCQQHDVQRVEGELGPA